MMGRDVLAVHVQVYKLRQDSTGKIWRLAVFARYESIYLPHRAAKIRGLKQIFCAGRTAMGKGPEIKR